MNIRVIAADDLRRLQRIPDRGFRNLGPQAGIIVRWENPYRSPFFIHEWWDL